MINPYLLCLRDDLKDETIIEFKEKWKPNTSKAKKYLLEGTNVKEMIQNEPSCALYALSVVLNSYGIKNKPFEQENISLQKIAKEAGFFHHGQINSVFHLGELASFIFCGYRIYHLWDASTIKDIVAREHLVVVPFDVDSKGNVCCNKGQSAHWGIIEDFKDNIVTVTHGWSDVLYEWNVDDLIKSNQQLEQTITYGKPNKVFSCVLLKNKILEIIPPQETI
jgi:hypothetical protein